MGTEIFAQGLCFYKIFSIFVIGAFLGDMMEMLYCRIKGGYWMSRSSFVYGQFSIVWGFAFVIATILFYNAEDHSVLLLYVAGVVLGGVFEYMCSLFTEKILKTKFWDYRDMPWNIKGRINLMYCQFWGLATVIWVKCIFPILDHLIEKIPVKLGEGICNILFLFFIINSIVSAAAIRRYAERQSGITENNQLWKWFDKKFPDQRMQKIYPLIKVC